MKESKQDLSAKETFQNMLLLIDRVEEGSDRYLIAKFIDFFITLPAIHQTAFINFFCDELPNVRWEKARGDDTLYLTAIRAITLHFTGLEKANQPTLKDLKNYLVAFQKSEHYKKCRIILRPKENPTFTDKLKTL
jgi:hypothetical protein